MSQPDLASVAWKKMWPHSAAFERLCLDGPINVASVTDLRGQESRVYGTNPTWVFLTLL